MPFGMLYGISKGEPNRRVELERQPAGGTRFGLRLAAQRWATEHIRCYPDSC